MQTRGQQQKVILTKKRITFVMTMVVLSFVFLFCHNVQAQTTATSTITEGVKIIEEPLGLPATDIRVIIAGIIRIALSLLGIILIILIMYGGALWMTSGGNQEQITKARKILVNAVIGLAIILSSYAIVLFVMRMLGVNMGNGSTGGPNMGAPVSQHFAGSGSLGRIIKDHYPERDQTDVPRNTKIIISFFKPILASSTIEDTNNTGIFGDCKKVANFKWPDKTICDRLITVNNKLSENYISIKNIKTGEKIPAAVALASEGIVNGVKGVYTIVIKPLTDLVDASGGYLGSNSEKIGYTVHLGKNIKVDDRSKKYNNIGDYPSIFDNYSWQPKEYWWNFITATTLDVTPPYIKSVYPNTGEEVAKNTVIQIDFNEAMDPIGLQGSFVSSSGYYSLENGYIFLEAEESKVPVGSFELSNGYRTLEFTSTKECGKNACGKSRYCLPVCDNTVKPKCESDRYTLLLRAGQTINNNTFESVPFSGVMDMSGNALDSNKNNKVTKVALASSDKPFPYSKSPDNFSWHFIIKDYIDITSPYLRRIVPGLDAEWVKPEQEWSMNFSKRMRAGSMYYIGISELPIPPNKVPIWKVPQVDFTSVKPYYTTTTMKHGYFLKLTNYFPIVTSSVEDVNYNCFYPGKGPDVKASKTTKLSPVCDGTNNCCSVSNEKGKDFCCNGTVNKNLNNNDSCIKYLK